MLFRENFFSELFAIQKNLVTFTKIKLALLPLILWPTYSDLSRDDAYFEWKKNLWSDSNIFMVHRVLYYFSETKLVVVSW